MESGAYSDMQHLAVQAKASLLELAANNDVEGFKCFLEQDPMLVDEVGLWYGRKSRSNAMVIDHRTPLMVAATYGSLDVMILIISLSKADINRTCGKEKTTALHCAASGGSNTAVEAVKLLLSAGSDPNILDSNSQRAADVIVVPPMQEGTKLVLHDLLSTVGNVAGKGNILVVTSSMNLGISLPHSTSMEVKSIEPKKVYPVDPSLPDIKNSMYSTDEFRMYSFKVRPCSRTYSHDWTECPFVHPGENARRRDPRKYHYSCSPCPHSKKGACSRGDMCDYAHGVFETWLHPALYRTRMCKDETRCTRQVCFFAHTEEELRSVISSASTAVMAPPSPDFHSVGMNFPPKSASGPANFGVPHLTASSSRLSSSLSASDIMTQDHEERPVTELSRLGSDFLGSSGQMQPMNPSNLDIFSEESSLAQLREQSILSPTNSGYCGGMMPTRTVEEPLSPMTTPISMLAQLEQLQQQFPSLSFPEQRSISSGSGNGGSSMHSWSQWGSSPNNTYSAINLEEFGNMPRSHSFELGSEDGLDVSWVQSLVKESSADMRGITSSSSGNYAGMSTP